MASQTKNIPLYFYYMKVEQSQSNDPYDAQATVQDICTVFNWIKQIGQTTLNDIKHEMTDKKKVMWLYDYTNRNTATDTRLDIVFKSAKYDQVREVRNTENMQSKGKVKEERDGDEEKTHLSLRLGKKNDMYVAVFESNHYGVTIVEVKEYINTFMNKYFEEQNILRSFEVIFDIFLSKDFLTELKKMKSRNVLSIIVDKEAISANDWLGISGRNDIKETVKLTIGKKGRGVNIPEDYISSLYNQMSSNELIKRIRVEGSNTGGQLKIDTKSMQMKHSLQVALTDDTHEVNTSDCFQKIQTFLDSIGGF